MAFPEEIAPLKEPGDPAGAFREEPRTLPGSRRYGFDQALVDADAPDGRVRAAAKRVEQVINHVLSTPDWVGGGLAELREQVHGILTAAGPTRTGRRGTSR